MRCRLVMLLVAVLVFAVGADATTRRHHHKRHQHHHKHHHKNGRNGNTTVNSTSANATEAKVVYNLKVTETVMLRGRVQVNGPLQHDFDQLFPEAVCEALVCNVSDVHVLGTSGDNSIVVDFQAPADVVHDVEDQAADPHSKLSAGKLRYYLTEDNQVSPISAIETRSSSTAVEAYSQQEDAGEDAEDPDAGSATPVQEAGIDIDTAMPYGELEPFGREDTAQELTEQSISESDEMVDQLERAEVAEEKRAVFRSLTRLRGAAITSFDGIARSQTGNIDEYNKVHKWRTTHPLRHLADEESDVAKWAFPDDADF